MKKIFLATAVAFGLSFSFVSCETEKCESCTITTSGSAVEQPELCGTDDELDNVKASYQLSVDEINVINPGSASLSCERR